MKYTRLTKRIADGEEAFLFHSSLHEGIERLAELEDKIERGELVEVPKGAMVLTPEEKAEEMRLADEERKQAVKEFAELVKMAFYYEFDELIPSIMADRIDELVKEVCGDDK